MDFNLGRNKYCPLIVQNNWDYNAPERFLGLESDEQSDTYAFGHLLYAILTGLFPYYDLIRKDRMRIRDLVINGTTPYIAPLYRNRTLIERRVVEIMERAWIYDPRQRATIFDVVKELRETRRMVLEANLL